jgi:hypothetical protein
MMQTTEHTPAIVQAALRSIVDSEDHAGTPAAWAILAAHAQRWLPGISASSDYDLSGERSAQVNIHGQEYVSGPSITLWDDLGSVGVMIDADSLTPEGERYSKGYTGIVSWG